MRPASLLFKGLDRERESSFLTVRAEASSLTSVRGRRLAPISHAGQGKGSPRDHHNLGSCALHRWPAPAPSCPSATMSTSTAAALYPHQPVTRYDQPGPASVPRRARIVRSDRSSSTRLSASSGDFSQRASEAPPSTATRRRCARAGRSAGTTTRRSSRACSAAASPRRRCVDARSSVARFALADQLAQPLPDAGKRFIDYSTYFTHTPNTSHGPARRSTEGFRPRGRGRS